MSVETMPQTRPPTTHDIQNQFCADGGAQKSRGRPTIVAKIMTAPQNAT